MKIKFQRRNHASLRKLTKVDESNNVIVGQPELYVRVEDVSTNLMNQDATPLTEEVFNNINWKDEKALMFQESSELPTSISGVTQIVSLESGEVWCVPGNSVAAFKLGVADISTYLKKNFQEEEIITLLGSTTKVGALPSNYGVTGNSSTSTYLEINDNSMAFKIKGTQKHLLNKDKVSFTHGNGEICINNTEVSLKNHSDKTTIGLTGGSFYIKGNNTQISEDLSNNKLNFYTNLGNAVYGNNAIYLEFSENRARFRTATNIELLSIKTDGTLVANGTNYIVNSSNIHEYIQTYLETSFENVFQKWFSKYQTKQVTFSGASKQIYQTLYTENKIFQIDFSDTQSSSIMTMYLKGSDIDNLSREYKADTGYYYCVKQFQAVDDSEDDYISIEKTNAAGSVLGDVWIRCIYRF